MFRRVPFCRPQRTGCISANSHTADTLLLKRKRLIQTAMAVITAAKNVIRDDVVCELRGWESVRRLEPEGRANWESIISGSVAGPK